MFTTLPPQRKNDFFSSAKCDLSVKRPQWSCWLIPQWMCSQWFSPVELSVDVPSGVAVNIPSRVSCVANPTRAFCPPQQCLPVQWTLFLSGVVGVISFIYVDLSPTEILLFFGIMISPARVTVVAVLPMRWLSSLTGLFDDPSLRDFVWFLWYLWFSYRVFAS